LHSKRLPFQVFPGIFSSIDSYSKKITNTYYEHRQELLAWLQDYGFDGKPVKAPGYQKFFVHHPDTDILLNGVVDEILELADGTYAFIDYKTSKFTKAQDRLLPLYETQLNGYAYIGERVGFSRVSRLALLYYEPVTDIEAGQIESLIKGSTFLMAFSANSQPVEVNRDMVEPMLFRVREIYDLDSAPDGTSGCKECQLVDAMVGLLNK
jgi:hypothetical protein